MKKFAFLLSLVAFVAFVGLSTSDAQNPKTTKVNKTEKVSVQPSASTTPAPAVEKDSKPAGCNHGATMDPKCSKPCQKACGSKDAKGCKDKKDAKCIHSGEKELK